MPRCSSLPLLLEQPVNQKAPEVRDENPIRSPSPTNEKQSTIPMPLPSETQNSSSPCQQRHKTCIHIHINTGHAAPAPSVVYLHPAPRSPIASRRIYVDKSFHPSEPESPVYHERSLNRQFMYSHFVERPLREERPLRSRSRSPVREPQIRYERVILRSPERPRPLCRSTEIWEPQVRHEGTVVRPPLRALNLARLQPVSPTRVAQLQPNPGGITSNRRPSTVYRGQADLFDTTPVRAGSVKATYQKLSPKPGPSTVQVNSGGNSQSVKQTRSQALPPIAPAPCPPAFSGWRSPRSNMSYAYDDDHESPFPSTTSTVRQRPTSSRPLWPSVPGFGQT